jgi:hypothetical protein
MRWRVRRSIPAVLAITLGLAVQLGSAGVAGAQVAGSDSGGRVVPVHQADGKSASALLGQVATLVFYGDSATQMNPCKRVGQTGHVLIYPGEQQCTIERGTPVFLSIGGSCDDVVDPTIDPNRDDYAVGEAAQRECAARISKSFVSGVSVRVDDGAAVDIFKPRYEVFSRQQHIQLPPGNGYGISPRPVTFVAFGWTALVQNLSVGMHTLYLDLEFPDGSSFTAVATVLVTTHHHG